MREIADARHFPNVEHPDVFNRIMLNWLQAAKILVGEGPTTLEGARSKTFKLVALPATGD